MEQKFSVTAGGVQNGRATLEDNLTVSYKTKHTSIILSSNHTPCYLPPPPKKLKIFVHTEICTPMFLAALFSTVRTWIEPRCPSVGERVNKFCMSRQWNIIQH